MLVSFSRRKAGREDKCHGSEPWAGTAAVLVLAAHLCLCLLGWGQNMT